MRYGPSRTEELELRYIATALDADQRYLFLHEDPLNGKRAPHVHRMAHTALCQAAYRGQTIRFARLMRVLHPAQDGPMALEQAIMANQPHAVARLLEWGTPLATGDACHRQAISVGDPRVLELLNEHMNPRPHVRRPKP